MTLPPDSPAPSPAEAVVVHHRLPSPVWLIPIIAAVVAAFLTWHVLSQRGPTITISWRTGDGLKAGQTKVEHKAVELGTVKSVTLSDDMTHVVATVEMQRQADRFLTDDARFWVVRPRLSAGNVSGIETLLSGAYIELDPGSPTAPGRRDFVGLEDPPAVRSDEPGRTFRLTADRLGSLSSGSPVFYRDIDVGEVLGYEFDHAGRRMTLQVFVRAPYDGFVHRTTHFWNASGVSVGFGPDGLRLDIESLRAVLAGGIAFDTDSDTLTSPVAETGATFPLYATEDVAASAGYRQQIAAVTYIEGSARGLSVGAPVELYGIRVGQVRDVKLEYLSASVGFRVAVHMQIQPERLWLLGPDATIDEVADRLVARGLRTQLRSSSLLTGQMVVALDFFPDAPSAHLAREGDEMVVPSVPGEAESLTAGAGNIVRRLNALPLEQIAANLNATLAGTNAIANGAEMHRALSALADSLAETRTLVRKLDAGVSPALARVPEISRQLQQTLEQANRLVASANGSYGQDSRFSRDLERLMGQVSDAARSMRLLADFLDQHPEALVRGRSGKGGD